MLIAPIFNSCRNDLDELPAWDLAEMSNMVFESREMGKTADGIDVVKYINVTSTYAVIKEENGIVECKMTVGQSTDLTRLVGIATISTAATIMPLDGSPKLGIPGDFSKEVKYKVVAADNVTSKVYKITVVKQ